MAEYILKEEVLELLRVTCVEKYPASFSVGLLAAANEIYNLSPVDVEEVIRCEKCEHGKKTTEFRTDCTTRCGLLDKTMIDKDFCSYGREKDGGENQNDA